MLGKSPFNIFYQKSFFLLVNFIKYFHFAKFYIELWRTRMYLTNMAFSHVQKQLGKINTIVWGTGSRSGTGV